MRIKRVIMNEESFTVVAQEIMEKVKIGDTYRMEENSTLEEALKKHLKFVVRQIEVSDDGAGFIVTLAEHDFLQTKKEMEDIDIRKFVGKKLETTVE